MIGGFAYWEPNDKIPISPFVTCQVGHAFAICRQKKISFDNKVWENLKQCLLQIDKYIYQFCSKQTILSLKSFSYYVLTKNEVDVTDKALQLFKLNGIEEFALESLGWLLVALSPKKDSLAKDAVESILKHLKNKVNETAETANFITSYGEDGKKKNGNIFVLIYFIFNFILFYILIYFFFNYFFPFFRSICDVAQ